MATEHFAPKGAQDLISPDGSINISPLRGWQRSLQSGYQLLKAFEVMGMSRPDRLFGLSFEENNLALLTRCIETGSNSSRESWAWVLSESLNDLILAMRPSFRLYSI